MRARSRIAIALSAVLGLAGVGALGAPTPALAHNYVVSTTPGEGESLTELPERFVITTNDVLLDLAGDGNGFAMQVVDDQGLFYGDGCITVEGPSMSTAAALGTAGDYTLVWQAVSADGHTISGEIPFTWSPRDSAGTSEGVQAPPTCGSTVAEQSEERPGETTAEEVASPDETSAGLPSDVLWVAGAAALLVLAVATTLALTRRRFRDESAVLSEEPERES
ncbi:copper resistance protein CopC [Salinibacterium sp. SYSU T00001]|uniref:copper resistance CopC family protein n=1 Tax=Homoserinimonas sedimenticola TaxID=2986805 RepID=UPI0022355E31|nr:copper resistance CopC family protein [Salinibacterium sedimenticola]MCW4384681.1 copper resistance protein CopC [Salinibacterium sedimenticola]